MSKTILVGQDMVQMDVYSLNLRVFVGTEVTILNSSEKVNQFLDLDSDIDLIIYVNNNDDNNSDQILGFVNDRNLSIPICVIGKVKNPKNFLNVFPVELNLKELIRFVAKTFDITAMDMVKMNVGEYFPIPIKHFTGLENMVCDIFVRLPMADGTYQYDRKCKKGEIPTNDIREEYLIKGITNFYVQSSDRLKFTNQVTENILEKLNSDLLSAGERISMASQAMDLTASNLYSVGLNEQTATMAKTCIQSIEKTIKDYPKLSTLLSRLLNSEESWAYQYCQILIYVTSHMVSKSDWGSREQIDKLNFVTFFQDLEFLAKDMDAQKLIPILNKSDLRMAQMQSLLSEEELDVVLNHASTASELVKDLPVTPFDVDVILRQHHGSNAGNDLAEEIQGNISHLAQLSIVAQDFTREIIQIDNLEKFQPSKIIRKLHTRYKKQRIKKFVDSLESISF